MRFRMVIGTWEKHEVAVGYAESLRPFSILVDGRAGFRHFRLLPWSARLGAEIANPGCESHRRVVEPPHQRQRPLADASNHPVSLDGPAMPSRSITS